MTPDERDDKAEEAEGKRPRRRRRKAADSEPAAAEAKKPRRRGRKKDDDAEQPAAEATEGTDADVDEEEIPEPKAEKKPRRRRKKDGDAKDAVAESQPADESKAAAKQKQAAKEKPATEDEPAADEKPATEKEPAAEKKPATERRPATGRTRRDAGEAPAVDVQVRARARYVRTSARKARMVCGHIRGKTVPEARALLEYTPRAASRDWRKVLESAVANAEHNHELVDADLRVAEAYADEGPTLKRYRPRAMGRATPIHKRTSHLTITLAPVTGNGRASRGKAKAKAKE